MKVPRAERGNYSGLFKEPLLDNVKRRFKNECITLRVDPRGQSLLVHKVVRENAPRYFEDYVLQEAADAMAAFQLLQEH